VINNNNKLYDDDVCVLCAQEPITRIHKNMKSHRYGISIYYIPSIGNICEKYSINAI